MVMDIESRNDIEILMSRFYEKLLVDDQVGFIFNDIVKIDLESHLPILADFWETTIFHKVVYKGNVLKIHQDLYEKVQLTNSHFERWLTLFNESVDELFKGNTADQFKIKALSIATVMRIKLHAV
jgi:hemoglobin